MEEAAVQVWCFTEENSARGVTYVHDHSVLCPQAGVWNASRGNLDTAASRGQRCCHRIRGDRSRFVDDDNSAERRAAHLELPYLCDVAALAGFAQFTQLEIIGRPE